MSTVKQHIDGGFELEDLNIPGVTIQYVSPENYSVTTDEVIIEDMDYSQTVQLLTDMGFVK